MEMLNTLLADVFETAAAADALIIILRPESKITLWA